MELSFGILFAAFAAGVVAGIIISITILARKK